MEIISTVSQMQSISARLRASNKKICLVPTMGYFHAGHISLMQKAKEISDIVIVSLFVNPTQFGPNEDFGKYPRDFERDRAMAENAGADYLFYPSADEMYPFKNNALIHIPEITNKFDGAKRPGHFDGVATIVAKLFNSAMPHSAVFGQKDFQQTLVIKRLVEDFRFDIEIVVNPTVRLDDGLAMSSRNTYLNPGERANAIALFRALNKAKSAIVNGERTRQNINSIMSGELNSVPDSKIDYASAALAHNLEEPDIFTCGQEIVLLVACYIGKTRLIDNMLCQIP